MKRHSVYWGFILLVSLFIWEGIKYEYSEAFKFITLTCFGVLSGVFMYLILNKLRCEAYKEPYAQLGADILHEFLSGKRGLARQLFGIWVFLYFAIYDIWRECPKAALLGCIVPHVDWNPLVTPCFGLGELEM